MHRQMQISMQGDLCTVDMCVSYDACMLVLTPAFAVSEKVCMQACMCQLLLAMSDSCLKLHTFRMYRCIHMHTHTCIYTYEVTKMYTYARVYAPAHTYM